MALFQRSFIYYPEVEAPERLNSWARQIHFQPWLDTEGNYTGWRYDANRGEGVLVIFHGNAGHALMREYWTRTFARLGASGFTRIYIFEYPGFGMRPGRPSEQSFLATAEKAIHSAIVEIEADFNQTDFTLLGESLGSGVATAMAAQFPEQTNGVLLVTPFTRLSDVGSAHFPFLPVRWMLRDRFDNVTNLQAVEIPVAILVADRDSVVPARLGRNLHTSLGSKSRLWNLPEADHNSLFNYTDDALWLAMLEFLREAGNAPER